MAKSLEQPEIKEWLGSTKDMLMAEKSGKDKDEEAKKLNGILENFDKMLPKIADTRAVVDCLWKCYQVSVLSTYWDIFHIAPDQGGRKLILDGEARVNTKNEILQKIVKFQHFYTKKS